MISVVLFDLDDTLFAHRAAVAGAIVAHTHDASTVARWRDLEEQHYPRYLRGEMDVFQQRRVRVREFVAPTMLTDRQADDWFAAYFREYQRAWKLEDDALPCLDALAHLRLGLITNGDLALQTEKVDAVGLVSRFEHVIASGEVGYAKPDPRIFERAASEFGVAVSDALYVGDRLRTDAIGAASAGLVGVWLDRHGTASSDELEAARASGVRVISTLAELPPLIAAGFDAVANDEWARDGNEITMPSHAVGGSGLLDAAEADETVRTAGAVLHGVRGSEGSERARGGPRRDEDGAGHDERA
jgi:putative hydrolase of the HAD superfamily